MELVLNFERKEIVVNESCNFKELNRRLEKLFGDKLVEWSIVPGDVKWVYQWWPTYPWYQRSTIRYDSYPPYEITCGTEVIHDSIFCVTDNKEYVED